jgi:TPR repeat protein
VDDSSATIAALDRIDEGILTYIVSRCCCARSWSGVPIACAARSIDDATSMTSERRTAGCPILRATLAAWLALAVMAGTAVAGPLEDAKAAERRDDYATALRIYRALAEKGDVGAQKRLGYFYEIGWGVKSDWLEAAKWYGNAAEAGDADAVRTLGHLGRNWVFKSPDTSDAAIYSLIERQAQKGYAVAQWSLGVMNYRFDVSSHAGRRNAVEAVAWYRRAAEQGHPDAQADLAKAYAEGIGVPQDSVEAYKWYDLAAANVPAPRGKQNFETIRADRIKQRNVLARRMTRAQIAEAQRLAREWQPKLER